MEDKEFSLFFEVVCCYHPTKYDPIGKDGIYVKEVRKHEAAQQSVQLTAFGVCPHGVNLGNQACSACEPEKFGGN